MHLWMKRNCSSRFGSQLFTSIWFCGLKKCFPFDVQITSKFSDVFGPSNFIAKLRQWPLNLNCVGEDSGSRVHISKGEVQSCFIFTMVKFWSTIFYFLKDRASWHLVWGNSKWLCATGCAAHIKRHLCLFLLVPFARRMCFPDKWNLEASLLSNLHERIRQRAYEDYEGSCTIHLKSHSSYRAPCR